MRQTKNAPGGRFFEAYFLPKILNILVPQVTQVPFIAIRPFFISTSSASFISRFSLHLTQYPTGICASSAICFLLEISIFPYYTHFSEKA